MYNIHVGLHVLSSHHCYGTHGDHYYGTHGMHQEGLTCGPNLKTITTTRTTTRASSELSSLSRTIRNINTWI